MGAEVNIPIVLYLWGSFEEKMGRRLIQFSVYSYYLVRRCVSYMVSFYLEGNNLMTQNQSFLQAQ